MQLDQVTISDPMALPQELDQMQHTSFAAMTAGVRSRNACPGPDPGEGGVRHDEWSAAELSTMPSLAVQGVHELWGKARLRRGLPPYIPRTSWPLLIDAYSHGLAFTDEQVIETVRLPRDIPGSGHFRVLQSCN